MSPKKAAKKDEGLNEKADAVKDLYEVMGIDDGIEDPDNASEKELDKELKELAKELDPKDNITDETREVLEGMGLVKAAPAEDEEEEEEPAPKSKKAAKKAEPEDEDEEPAPKAKFIKKAKAVEEDEEDADADDDDGPEVEEEPAPKAKPAAKKKGGFVRDLSNCPKAHVWKAWKRGKGETDSEKLFKLVKGKVKLTTIRSWLGSWKKGNGLPAVANQK